MAKEQRTSPRIAIEQPIKVTNLSENKVIGHLVNLSSEGLMLLTSESLPISHIYQLEMCLNYADNSERIIKFGAESLWSQETSTPGHDWVGFHIIDISGEDQEILDKMVDD